MQINEMHVEDIDSVLPLYIEYYNKYEDSCWTEETAKKRIKQVLTIDDSFSLIMRDEDDNVCGLLNRTLIIGENTCVTEVWPW